MKAISGLALQSAFGDAFCRRSSPCGLSSRRVRRSLPPRPCPGGAPGEVGWGLWQRELIQNGFAEPFLQVASVQEMLMPLAFREKLTMLMPPSLFYRRRIAEETRSGEPNSLCWPDGAARRYRH